MIRFKTLEAEHFTWLFVEARRGKPDRADLLRLEFPEVLGTKGLVFSCGKLPVWTVLGAASHYRNRTQWQAVYDPSEKGAIVIFSFSQEVLVGDRLEAKLPCIVCRDEGRETYLRAGALYPYCQQYGHQNYAPERQTYQPKS